jgi:hypothetical protein
MAADYEQEKTMAKVAARSFSLELSDEEAAVLVAIGTYIGGAPSGPRGVVDSIVQALKNAGAKDLTQSGYALTGSTYIHSPGTNVEGLLV